jgi:hypothetical protein
MANSPLKTCVALTSVLTVLAGSAAAREDQCVRGDVQVRRVEIAVQDPGRGVPCEVVYWKDTEEPGVRRVLWSAQTDADFCTRKADELTAKLTAVGWTCTSVGGAAAVREAAPPSRVTGDSPAPAVAAAPAAEPAEPAPAPAAEAEPTPAPAIREALAPQTAVPAPEPVPTTTAPAADALAAIIEQNLARLNDGVDGSFDAMIADYGDLDGDGFQDGLVLFTYESQRLGQARFVAAYLYDGESYALAATKPLAGSDDQVLGAEIESIDAGVISLRLSVLEPGDAACCPSGVRRQALMLRNGQLIEVNAAASTGESRS